MAWSKDALRERVHALIEQSPYLQSKFGRLESDVSTLKSDSAQLRADLHHFGLVQDQMQRDIRMILDAVIPVQRRGERFEEVADTVDRHEVRLTAVEDTVKDHLRSATSHKPS